jgi:hypothetical protein
MFKSILKLQYLNNLRYFKNNKTARLLISLSMLTIIILIAYGVFIASQSLLAFTQTSDDFLSQVIPLYIYQLFLLITGFLVFLSTSIFVLLNFFNNKKDEWILATPSFFNVYWLNNLKALVHYSWPIIVIIIPLILAVKQVFDLSIISLMLSFLSVFLFSIICSLAAICLIFLISVILLHLKKLDIYNLIIISISAIIALAVLIWQKIVNMNLERLFQINETSFTNIDLIKNHFAVFPSSWPATIIYNLQNNNFRDTIDSLFLIMISSSFLFILLYFFKIKFLKIWQALQTKKFEAKGQTNFKGSTKLLFKPKTVTSVFYYKELLQSIRSPKTLLWLIFLSALLFAQIGTISLIAQYSNLSDFIIDEVLIAIQLSIVLFFISAFILRFVFPSLSQEGSTAWIIGSAPINLFKIFVSKYKFYLILLNLIALISIFLYIIPQATNLLISLSLILMLAMSVATLTMIGLSFGAIFINFSTNDPQELSSSGPGILFTILALSYSALNSYLLYLFISLKSLYPLVIALMLSLSLIYYFKHSAKKRLDNLEFN